jgi:hypothetical protein
VLLDGDPSSAALEGGLEASASAADGGGLHWVLVAKVRAPGRPSFFVGGATRVEVFRLDELAGRLLALGGRELKLSRCAGSSPKRGDAGRGGAARVRRGGALARGGGRAGRAARPGVLTARPVGSGGRVWLSWRLEERAMDSLWGDVAAVIVVLALFAGIAFGRPLLARWRFRAVMRAGGRALAAGELKEAERILRAASESRMARRLPNARGAFLTSLAQVLLQQGRAGEAEKACEEVIA